MLRAVFYILVCLLYWTGGAKGEQAIPGDPFAATEGNPIRAAAGNVLEFGFGCFFESRNQLSIQHPKNPVSLRQRAQFETFGKYGPLSFFGSAELAFEAAAPSWVGEHRRWLGGIREAYLTYDSPFLDLFVGRKIHRWGVGDGINPMDLINPIDTRDPLASGRADNRVSVWMADATLHLGDFAFEAIYLPVAGVNKLPRAGSPWVTKSLRQIYDAKHTGELYLQHQHIPDTWLADTEYGLRISRNLAGWDLAAMFFHGYADEPILIARHGPGDAGIRPEHRRFKAIGASFAKGIGTQTVRGEIAAKPRYPIQGDNATLIRRDLFQAVLGWDWDIEGIYYINVQTFADIFGSDPGDYSKNVYGSAYEVSVKWANDEWKAGVRGKIYAKNDGALTELFVEYALDDNWTFMAGVMLWAGGHAGALGQYQDKNFIYCTAKYTF